MALKLSEQEAKDKEQQLRDQSTSAPTLNPYHQSQQQQQSHQQMARDPGFGGIADSNSNPNFGNSILDTNQYEPVNNPYLQHQQQVQYPQHSRTSNSFGNPQQQHQPATFNPLRYHRSQYGRSTFFGNTHQQQPAFNNSPSQSTLPAGSKNPFSKALSHGGQPPSKVSGQNQLDSHTYPSSATNAFEQSSMSSSSVYPFNSSTLSSPSSPSFSNTTAGQAEPFVSRVRITWLRTSGCLLILFSTNVRHLSL